jgi:Lon protease-like protein
MPTTSDRELRAQLKLAARSYRKAQALHAAHPSAKNAAKVAVCEARLTMLLEALRGELAAVA